MQIAVLAVRTWPVVPDLVSLGSIAETQLQGSCLSLEDTRLTTGVSLPPGELSRRLDALSARSGSAQQQSEPSQQPIDLRLMSPMQGSPAFPPPAALTSPGPARNPVAAHESQADWGRTDAQRSRLHQLPGRGFQSQAAIPHSSRAAMDVSPLQQQPPLGPPSSRGHQRRASYPAGTPQQAQIPAGAAHSQRHGGPLTTLGLLGQQVLGMTGSGTNNPTSQSHLGHYGTGSRAVFPGLQHSRHPSAVVSNTLGADFPMDLLALPGQPSAQGPSQGFLHGRSAADAPPPDFGEALRKGLDQRAALNGPALHQARLHGMGHMPTSAHDTDSAALHSSLLTLAEMGIPSMRAPMGAGDQRRFHEDTCRAGGEPLHGETSLPSLAELCLPPRNSSSASAQDEDTTWVPELPVLPRRRISPEHPMDLADLL